MLDPLDRFLSLQPNEPSFLNMGAMLLRRAYCNQFVSCYSRTPATEEYLDSTDH